MSCPSCGFTEWKLVRLIHEQGLNKVDLSTESIGGSVGSAGLNVGIGSSDTTGTVQSALSERAKPPENYLSAVFIISGLLAGMFGGLWFAFSAEWSFFKAIGLGTVCTVAGSFVGIWLYSASCPTHKEKHNAELDAWSKRRMCLRCGTFYDPA